MAEKEPATETIVPPIATEETAEQKIARLETEKQKVITERDNYKAAYLKADKGPDGIQTPAPDEDATRRLIQEELANSRLADIAREQDEIIKIALKENKELKAAALGKVTEPPAGMGAHSEGAVVRDTTITPEQMKFFKDKGWTDKDIERYKANLRKKV